MSEKVDIGVPRIALKILGAFFKKLIRTTRESFLV